MMSFKMFYGFHHIPNGLNTPIFVQTMSHCQGLIVMAQNIRSAQSYIKWPTYKQEVLGHKRLFEQKLMCLYQML